MKKSSGSRENMDERWVYIMFDPIAQGLDLILTEDIYIKNFGLIFV